MSRSVSPTRVVIAIGAVAGALALAGCGAGQITQTSTQVSGVDAGSATVGQIAVRGAEFPFAGNGDTAVIYPTGGTAPLRMTVVNTGGQPDKLTAATSPVAGSVKIVGDATVSGGKKLLVDGEPAPEAAPSSAVAAAPSTAAAGATRAPGAAPTPRTTAGPTPLPTATAAATTGPSADGTTSAQVVLTGLKEDLQAGRSYPVVLTFQQAGDVTVQVPVGNPGEGSATG